MNVRDVDRELRTSLWRKLREVGFETRTTRAGWRYWDGGVEVLDVQSVGADADAVGRTSYSFGACLGSLPGFLGDPMAIPVGRDGRLRPHYWNCPLQRGLEKTIAQPWFHAFSRDPGRPLTNAAAKQREGLRQVLRTDVHDRADVWYVLPDGSNIGFVVADLVGVVLDTLPDFTRLRDPCVVLARLQRGDFVHPDSPRGDQLVRTARGAHERSTGR